MKSEEQVFWFLSHNKMWCIPLCLAAFSLLPGSYTHAASIIDENTYNKSSAISFDCTVAVCKLLFTRVLISLFGVEQLQTVKSKRDAMIDELTFIYIFF